jgi:hypothetical protein
MAVKVLKSGSLMEPSQPVKTCNGIALSLPLYYSLLCQTILYIFYIIFLAYILHNLNVSLIKKKSNLTI